MQIKSWQIAFVGSIPALGLIGFMILVTMSIGYDRNTFSVILFIIAGLLAVLTPVLLLKSKSSINNVIGGLISIILGLIGCFYFINLFFYATGGPDLTRDDIIRSVYFFIPFISGSAFLAAGIHYFRKKV